MQRVTAAMILIQAGSNKLKLYCSKLVPRSLQIEHLLAMQRFFHNILVLQLCVSWSLFQKVWHGTFFQLSLNTVLLLSTLIG